MAKYDRAGLRAKLEARMQAVYDNAAERNAMAEASFKDYIEGQISYHRKQIKEHEEAVSRLSKMKFGEVPAHGYYNAPKPVVPDEGLLQLYRKALDELDILVGDEVTLKSTAMLKLL